MDEITGKDGIKGELPEEKPIGWFCWRMRGIKEGMARGKKYTIRHKFYLSGTGEEKQGRIVNTKMTLVGKYPHGALFRVNQGWNEFFTWSELAAGGLIRM